jgi:hypothetical protein
MYENKMLKRMFGPKKEKVIGDGENYAIMIIIIIISDSTGLPVHCLL